MILKLRKHKMTSKIELGSIPSHQEVNENFAIGLGGTRAILYVQRYEFWKDWKGNTHKAIWQAWSHEFRTAYSTAQQQRQDKRNQRGTLGIVSLLLGSKSLSLLFLVDQFLLLSPDSSTLLSTFPNTIKMNHQKLRKETDKKQNTNTLHWLRMTMPEFL